MATKLVRATDAEKAAWSTAGELYPLYGFLVVDGERRPVEDLRARWGKDDPQFEVHTPNGRRYFDGTHTRLCFNLEDVREWGAETTEADPGEEGDEGKGAKNAS